MKYHDPALKLERAVLSAMIDRLSLGDTLELLAEVCHTNDTWSVDGGPWQRMGNRLYTLRSAAKDKGLGS